MTPKPFFPLALLLIMLTVTAGVRSAQSCGESEGTLTRHSYRSQIAATDMYYTVYTPPCYAATQSVYPVIYLMHGSNEDDGQWTRLGLKAVLDAGISAGKLPPIIAVMPFGEWIANENQFDAVSWENVFLQELMPLAESTYRVDARRATQAIGGISRGGFWAYEIAFRHPDLFSAVGGHSAFFDDYHAPPEYNPLRLAASADRLDSLRLWLDRGQDDYAAPGLDLMSERLTARGIAHQYTVYPEGQHYFTYWEQHVAEYVAFYTTVWMADVTIPAVTPIPQPVVFATNTPAAPVAVPSSSAETGYALFVPVVAFPSLQSNITEGHLAAVRAGSPDSNLVVDSTTAAALRLVGITLAAETVILPDAELLNTLWRDRRLYSLLAVDRLTPRLRMLHVDDMLPFDLPPERYPFAFTAGVPNFYPDRLTRLLLSGVTALTRTTRDMLDQNGVEWAAGGILPVVSRADFFHTSNEVSFSPGCPDYTEQPLGAFCSKKEHFDLLTLLGLDIVELTGNHNNDFGTTAYVDTLHWYQDGGIRTVGGGETLEQARQPLLIDHNGNQIAMLACNAVGPYYALAEADAPGAADCDWEWLRETLPALAAQVDLLVVTMQYLEVEDYRPTAQQELDFRGLADLGADVVIGTQAHKPQTIEFYGSVQGVDTFLHYGLGNLFFDQPFWGNMRFFMDQLLVYEGRLLGVDLFTGIIDDNARPRPMTAEESSNFLAFMFNTQGGF